MNYLDTVPATHTICLHNAMFDVRGTHLEGQDAIEELQRVYIEDIDQALKTLNDENWCRTHPDLVVVVLYKGIEVDAIMDGHDIVGIAVDMSKELWSAKFFATGEK